jgi:hypothetical protein
MGCYRTDLCAWRVLFHVAMTFLAGYLFLGRGRGRGDTKSMGRGM